MKSFARLSLLAAVAVGLAALSGCTTYNPEYMCLNSCKGKPYLIPKREACGDVLPPPGGPWYFERGPVKKKTFK